MTALPNDAASEMVHGEQALPASLRGENVRFGRGAGGGAAIGLLLLGIVLLGAGAGLAYTGFAGAWFRQAVAAYMVGVFSVLAICLGATFFVMVFHLLSAGWTATIRRQFENVMGFLPFAWLMLLPILGYEIAVDGHMFKWLHGDFAGDYLLQKKAVYFFFPAGHDSNAFPAFFVARTLFYGLFWFILVNKLRGLSLEQDRTGDKWLTAKAKFTCAWAMPIFALTIAFVAFDYLMALDFKFFSTMWGVYYFAGSAFSAIAMVTLICNWLLKKGKLQGVVTEEHFHDLGKLQFSFTVFWAYIAFSQYFLIWYSNIPEETAFFIHRKEGGWRALGIFLIVGHFVAPFLILVSRHVKKNLGIMLLMSTWCLIAHIADIFWIIRPMVYLEANEALPPQPALASGVIDVLMILGVLALFIGHLVRTIPQQSLVAVHDPYMGEGLEHKNYV